MELLFSVYDKVSASFEKPFVAPTAGSAARAVRMAVAEPGHPYQRYPADYELYQVGLWDRLTGTVHQQVSEGPEGTRSVEPLFVCSLATLVEEKEHVSA